MPISLVLADDHPVFVNGLASVLSMEDDLHVAATCGDGDEALEAVNRLCPDIAILDMKMPRASGLQIARHIRDAHLPTKVVLLTGSLEEEETLEALRLGVRGIFLKNMPAASIMQCLRKVHAGEQWVEHGQAMQALEKILRREEALREVNSTLTPREIEVVLMVTQGLRNKEIAERLFVSEGTVKVHLHNIYQKLDVDGRMALVRYARQKGLA